MTEGTADRDATIAALLTRVDDLETQLQEAQDDRLASVGGGGLLIRSRGAPSKP